MSLRKYKSLFSATLQSSIGTGTGDTITLNSAAGLPTDTEITITIDRVDANGNATPSKMERITGTLSGSNLTSYTRGVDGTTEQAHSSGAVIEMVWNAADWNANVDALLEEHNVDGTHSVSKMITEGTVLDEDDMASNSATALATQQSIKAYVDSKGDWKALGQTLTYASADDPTYTATVAGVDLTDTLSAGMRLRVSQSTGGTKYFIITAVAFSTDTTITLYGGTDYNLENEAISSPVFATVKAPVGFPLDPSKWSVAYSSTSDSTESSPTSNTWYNTGSHSLVVPIGVWNITYSCLTLVSDTSSTNVDIKSTLSTANNSESHPLLTVYRSLLGASGTIAIGVGGGLFSFISLASKTTFYLNFLTRLSGMNGWDVRGQRQPIIIRAVSAYL